MRVCSMLGTSRPLKRRRSYDVLDAAKTKWNFLDFKPAFVKRDHKVSIHHPLADPDEARVHYGVDLPPMLNGTCDCAVLAVARRAYAAMTATNIAALMPEGRLVADIKGIWRGLALPDSMRRWQL